MIVSSDINLLRMNNKLCVNIGKMTIFGLLKITNCVVGMMEMFYQSANSAHCFTYSTFHDKKILSVYIKLGSLPNNYLKDLMGLRLWLFCKLADMMGFTPLIYFPDNLNFSTNL